MSFGNEDLNTFALSSYHAFQSCIKGSWCIGGSQIPAFGGQSASVGRKYGGPGACPRENFLGPRPSDARKTRETPFSVIFCIINVTTFEHKRQDVLLKFDQEFILIIASYSKKAKEEFLFSYKRSNISSTKYEMDLLSLTAK